MSAQRPQPRPKRRASETQNQQHAWQGHRCKDAQSKTQRKHAWSANPSQALLFGESMRELSALPSALKAPLVGAALVIIVGLMKRAF
jgi:hypothetical protein